eukprot:2745782-Amphidinium_carterae.1
MSRYHSVETGYCIGKGVTQGKRFWILEYGKSKDRRLQNVIKKQNKQIKITDERNQFATLKLL